MNNNTSCTSQSGKICSKCHEWCPSDQYPKPSSARCTPCIEKSKSDTESKRTAQKEERLALRQSNIQHGQRIPFKESWSNQLYYELYDPDRPYWPTDPPIDLENWYSILRAKRIAENGGSHTREEFYEVCCQYNWQCLRCKTYTTKLHADHVISVASGGSSDISNIQPLCPDCNFWKNAKCIDYRPKP